jgi:hypothetical protein
MKGFAILAGLLATGASAHMQMSKPYPIRSPLNKDSNEQKDYSYTNPLNPSGADYPCKGYANDAFQSQASYSPGQTYELELDGSATHSGGSCQLALTYDRGKTFKVIESMLGECPISKKYEFAIPSDAPTGEALLAWTWFNKVGNREMYMNCAMVTIGGSASSGNKTQSTTTNGKNSHGTKMMGKHMAEEMKHLNHPPMEHTMERRDTADTTVMMDKSKTAAFNSLPEIFVANVAQTGGCVTIEGEAVDFPEPGSNVVGKIDGSGKGYKCTGTAPFLSSDSSTSTATTAATTADSSASSSSASSNSTPSSNSTTSTNSTTASNSTKSDSTKNNSSISSSKKADDKKTTSTASSSSTTTAATTLAQAMSMIASAFGSPSADPRVLGSQSNNQVASTSNSFANYVTKWTCTSGEILCSPDGYSWAMCSNSRPIFMGNVAPGMICQLGQMVRSGW